MGLVTTAMLQIRPNCEACDKDLAPSASERQSRCSSHAARAKTVGVTHETVT